MNKNKFNFLNVFFVLTLVIYSCNSDTDEKKEDVTPTKTGTIERTKIIIGPNKEFDKTEAASSDENLEIGTNSSLNSVLLELKTEDNMIANDTNWTYKKGEDTIEIGNSISPTFVKTAVNTFPQFISLAQRIFGLESTEDFNTELDSGKIKVYTYPSFNLTEIQFAVLTREGKAVVSTIISANKEDFVLTVDGNSGEYTGSTDITIKAVSGSLAQ